MTIIAEWGVQGSLDNRCFMPNFTLAYDYAQASGGEWNKDLLFKVPYEHAEMQRLEGRYKKYAQPSTFATYLKSALATCTVPVFFISALQSEILCSVGGLKEGLVVELANGSKAMVLDVKGMPCCCNSVAEVYLTAHLRCSQLSCDLFLST